MNNIPTNSLSILSITQTAACNTDLGTYHYNLLYGRCMRRGARWRNIDDTSHRGAVRLDDVQLINFNQVALPLGPNSFSDSMPGKPTAAKNSHPIYANKTLAPTGTSRHLSGRFRRRLKFNLRLCARGVISVIAAVKGGFCWRSRSKFQKVDPLMPGAHMLYKFVACV